MAFLNEEDLGVWILVGWEHFLEVSLVAAEDARMGAVASWGLNYWV